MGFDKEKYRTLQKIWKEGAKYKQKGRYGFAKRIYQEGIRLAESSEHNDPSRLKKLRRGLGSLYIELGNFSRAKELLRTIERYDKLGDLFFSLSQYEQAIKSYKTWNEEGDYRKDDKVARSYFLMEKYENSLDEYKIAVDNMNLRKIDCTAVLLSKYEVDEKNTSLEGEKFKKNYPQLYREIKEWYDGWKNAVIHIEEKGLDQLKASLRKKFQESPDLVEEPDLEYEQDELQKVLDKAKGTYEREQEIQKAIYIAGEKSPKQGREHILSIFSEKELKKHYSYHEIYRDLYILECKFDKALDWYPEGFFSSGTHTWNKYLNLLYLSGRGLSGRDLAERYKYLLEQSTNFLRENKDLFHEYCQNELDEFEKNHGCGLLEYHAEQVDVQDKHEWSLLTGFSGYWEYKNQFPFRKHAGQMISFHTIEEFEEQISSMLDGAENEIRAQLGLPKIGEGWISESSLYREINEALDAEVIHHGSPKWLGQQHLDVWIPAHDIAVEYHGKQHFEPVEFFGGEEAYRETVERDERKKRLCEENDVDLIIIKSEDDTEEVIQSIRKKI